jgi:CRP/FNR family cyclic AMP-dependent transcriptional regulator
MNIALEDFQWQEFSLFTGVSEEIARKFLSVGFHFRYEPGNLLISNQDAGETFFLVLHGMAKLVLMHRQTEAMSIMLFRAGDFFGELSILGADAERSGDIMAITPMDVLVVQKKDFLRLMEEHPILALNVARELGRRIRNMNERLVTNQLPDDFHRVAHTLLLLLDKSKTFNAEGPILMPPLSLKEWASFCYTTQQVFMESIMQLKEAGILEWQSQRIAIIDVSGLKQCAELHQSRLEDCLHPQL